MAVVVHSVVEQVCTVPAHVCSRLPPSLHFGHDQKMFVVASGRSGNGVAGTGVACSVVDVVESMSRVQSSVAVVIRMVFVVLLIITGISSPK